MPQLIFLVVLIGGGYLLYKRFVSDAARLAQKSRNAQRERENGAIGTLVKDPETGEYRVRREDDT